MAGELEKDNEEWKVPEFVENSDTDITEGDLVYWSRYVFIHTASTGTINYINRFGTGIYTLHMQIDALVNQGNSGGPVINTDGQKVAGIVVIYYLR